MKEEIQSFIEGKQQANKSYHTIKAYSLALSRFANFFDSDKPTSKITKQDILLFLNQEFPVQEEKIAMRNHLLKVLHRFFHENDRNDLCIYIETIKPRYTHEQIVPYKKEDIMAALDKASSRDKALITLLATSGLRISEALKLRRTGINLKELTGRILGKGRKKGQKEDLFVFSPEARDYLAQYFAEEGITERSRRLIFNLNGEETKEIMKSYYALRYEFKKKYGISQFHRLRHFFGTEAINSGLKPRTVQKLMRHKQFSSTEIYITDDDKELVKEYMKKPITIEASAQ